MSQFSDKLHSAPFFRLLVPFIAGIVLGNSLPPEQKWFYLGTSLFFLLLLIVLINTSFKREHLFGIFSFPALLILGLFITCDLKYRPQPLQKGEYFAVVHEFPLEKEKSYRAVIRLTKPRILVLAYFEKSEQISRVEPGDVIWFRGQPELLQKTGNPFEFDYQAYAVRNGIGHRIYLKDGNYFPLKAQKNLDVIETALIIRDRLLRIIENCGLKGEVFHLVSSISLGAREELEPETTQSFAKTGVIHVLAVSGMNVAIIFVVLDWMLRFLKRKKGGIYLYTFIILGAVWGYALITGMSASVLRAAAMFTFIVIGTGMSRHPNIYNSLAASAFVLLFINPSLVYDVGFQLSYAAVFSIVCFHPFIYGLFYFRYWISDQIWTLLSVSMAAQIGTLPLLLHYFHQFPTWFLLANLMVIPLVTLILYLTFIVFVVAPIIPILGKLMTLILYWAGQGMLFSVHFVERLPYSILDGLYPSDLNLFIVILFTITTAFFIVYKRPKALIVALVLLITFFLFSNITDYQNHTQREVVVFNLPGKTLIAMTTGSETIWLTTDKVNTHEKLKYYIKPYEGFRRIAKSSIICKSDSLNQVAKKLLQRENFLNFDGLSLCVFTDRKLNDIDWKHFPTTDVIILSEKSLLDPAFIRKCLPETVIIESRLSGRSMNDNSDASIALNDPEIMNSTIGGAVKIEFRRADESGKNIISCGYFNR
ncbi:MAG TPA: ComEC/Rec2 family competence protein [Prolixibacteraceae bacterium]|nr:ComEC/Rec2 family competence protein [Prolixibacteraceae bacterium]